MNDTYVALGRSSSRKSDVKTASQRESVFPSSSLKCTVLIFQDA